MHAARIILDRGQCLRKMHKGIFLIWTSIFFSHWYNISSHNEGKLFADPYEA
jgi:hypothetical protein